MLLSVLSPHYTSTLEGRGVSYRSDTAKPSTLRPLEKVFLSLCLRKFLYNLYSVVLNLLYHAALVSESLFSKLLCLYCHREACNFIIY